MRWRWDQGRLDYFEFDVVKKTAKVLRTLENAVLRSKEDPLRAALMSATGLPFSPADYRVWRNYKRVFECCLLAADIDGKIICTELCHQLANDLGGDSYFANFARRFYYPSPIFEGYNPRGQQIFPIVALLKLLLAKAHNNQEPSADIKEILELLVANACTGFEAITHYSMLRRQSYKPAPDEERQTRELLCFISQLSFLKWVRPKIFLDVDVGNKEALSVIEDFAQPLVRSRNSNPARELLNIGTTGGLAPVPLVPTPAIEGDVSFIEGKPKRVSHLRYERSPKLREMYFRAVAPPFICDMCRLNVTHRYSWTRNLLELHHLLPLASPIRVEAQSTSLSQLVAICPSCHKATHVYYRNWLDERRQEDFLSYEEAKDVYELAKHSIN